MPNLKNISAEPLLLTPLREGGTGGKLAAGATANIVLGAYEVQYINSGKMDNVDSGDASGARGGVRTTERITGSFTANGQTSPALDVKSMAAIGVDLSNAANSTATIQYEYSPDNGTTWRPLSMVDTGLAASDPFTAQAWAAQIRFVAAEGGLPSHATHFRLRVSAWSLGSIAYVIQASDQEIEPAVAVAGTVALRAGAAAIGTVALGAGSAAVGTVSLGSKSSTRMHGATSGAIKASAGVLHSLHVANTAAAIRYLKLYNLVAAPALGAGTPFLTIPLPAGGSRDLELPHPLSLSTGISWRVTQGLADNDAVDAVATDITGMAVFA